MTMTLNPFKLYVKWLKWLYERYNRVGITAGNKVLVRVDENTYRPAGVKGQIIGNLVVQGYICAVVYWFWRMGKQQGHEEGRSKGYQEAVEHYDEAMEVWK
jgi:hypothetical protein